MREFRASLPIAVLGLLLAHGCGGRDAPTLSPFSTVSGVVFQGERDHPVMGARVWIDGATSPNTTFSDILGHYRLTLPPGLTTVLKAEKAGLLSAVRSVLSPKGGEEGVDLALLSEAYVAAKLGDAGMPTYDRQKGLVAIVFSHAIGGEMASLSAASDGSIVINKKTDKGVRSNVIIPDGADALVFCNVTPGHTRVSLAAAGCKPRYPEIDDYLVVAGALSMIDVDCSP
jgi:hypothetical protein